MKKPVAWPGWKIQWTKCRRCGNVAHYQYQPHSLSNPVLTLPCGHGLTERFHVVAECITEEEALAIIDREENMDAHVQALVEGRA